MATPNVTQTRKEKEKAHRELMMKELLPQQGKQELAYNLNVDVLIYGGAAGSGKSRLIIQKAFKYAVNDPNFEGVLFRRTSPPLKGAGGLFPESRKLYSVANVHVREKDMEIIFRGTQGGTLKYTHLEHESDAEGNHQGLQYSFVGFDELTHFSQTQFIYLLGRLRSESESDSFCMATCNPDADSWVRNWVEWYLCGNGDGRPDPDKCGVVRYFIIVEDAPVFANTPEELIEKYPEVCYQENPTTGESILVKPMSFAFIGGNIFDNPELIRKNPKYLSALKAQTEINRRRLLDGDWYARPQGSANFQREWLGKVSKVPDGSRRCRGIDKASSEPSDKYRSPDYTASIKMSKCRDGFYYIEGNFHPDTLDESTMVYGRMRLRAGARDQMLLKQARLDGVNCTVILPKDPSAAGAVEFQESAKKFISAGYRVKEDPMPNNKKKLIKFEPFSSAAQIGLVYIVESSFGNQATLEAYYKELEAFDGERSTATKKDDWADCTASAFNFLAKEKAYAPVSIPSCGNANTIKARML